MPNDLNEAITLARKAIFESESEIPAVVTQSNTDDETVIGFHFRKGVSVGEIVSLPGGHSKGIVLVVVDPVEYVNDYGMPTSRSALALDHWTNAMTSEARASLLASFPDDTRTEGNALKYVSRHLLDFSIADGNVLSAVARPPASRAEGDAFPAGTVWDTFEAIAQVCAALPDPSFAKRCGLNRDDVRLIADTVRGGRQATSELEQLRRLRLGMRLLTKTRQRHGPAPEDLMRRLQAAEVIASVRASTPLTDVPDDAPSTAPDRRRPKP